MTVGSGSPLVGRTRELDELRDAARVAFGGRAQVVLVVGEPGIGKTRLADAFATEIAADGAIVAWGRAWEAGGAPPFWPWTEALRSVCAVLDEAVVRAAASSGANTLGQLVPELRSCVAEAAEATDLDPQAARFRLFDAVVTFLAALSRQRPIVLVLDDVHCADLGSLQLLHFVARSLRTGRLLILGTHRDVEARLSPYAGETLARIAREGRWLKLARLDREAIAGWVAELGIGGDDALVERLWTTTEGNPLFVVESLRLAKSHARPGATSGISDGVRDVIGRRLATLAPETRALTEAGAIFGRRFEIDKAAAIRRIDPVRARDLVAQAVRNDVLVELDASRAEFTHVLLREVLYGELSARDRAEAHAAAAQLLMPADPGYGDASLSELVHHVFAAVPVIPEADAIAWARRAAERAIGALAFDDAVAQLERALGLLADDPAHDEQRCELLLELAEAQFGAGRATAVHASSRGAATLARRLGDPERLARAALAFGRVLAIAVVSAELVGLLEEALAGLPDGHDALRARLLARLASALQPARDFEHPMELAREAIAMVRRTDDRSAQLEVFVAGGGALAYFAEPRERVALDEELVTLADEIGDRTRGLRGRLRLAYDLVEKGDVGAADAMIDEYDRLARRVGLPAVLWPAPVLRGMRAIMSGRFADAEVALQEAEAIASRIDDLNAPMTFAFQRAGALSAASRRTPLAGVVGPLVDALFEHADPWYARAFAAGMTARIGRIDAARTHLQVLADDLDAMTGRLSLVWAAEAVVAVGDRALGAALLERSLSLADRVHCWSMLAMVAERPVTHALGILAAQQERHDDAIAWLDDAHSRCTVMGATPHRVVVELDLVEVLRARDAAGDRERARRLLDAAAETSASLSLADLQPRIDRLAGELGPRRARAADVPQVARFSMRRDGDVWAIEGTTSFRLKDSRGLQILARLVAEPGRELHVVDLMAPAGEGGLVGDAGEVLDATAIAAYRRRLEALREQEHEAEAWADVARQERIRAEIEALAAELAAAVGLGGRSRKVGSTAEKARINVRQRLRHALDRIAEQDPGLGQHLRWAVRTGSFCAYDPTGR